MDCHSQSNCDEFVTTSLKFHLDVSFDVSELKGHTTLSFKILSKEIKKLILDISRVEISAVELDGKDTAFTVEPSSLEWMGEALVIPLPSSMEVGQEGKVKIYHSCGPKSSGLEWLPPSQTEGKKYPYLYTQFQAIHARSVFPCQDTPGVKSYVEGCLVVDDPLVAVLIGEKKSAEKLGNGKTAYTYACRLPIPSYLIAFGVGHLVSRTVGPRSQVWSEIEMVEKGAYEFAETEKFIAAAEDMLTPYAWGRYDILLLPGSFPYGGMENPCITFVTPTLLAGDRSLAGVVAHEIAHSWSGNLVTNQNWSNFWLNEGFTVFIERKIIGRVYGEKMRQFSHVQGHKALLDAIEHFRKLGTPQFTTLIQSQEGTDPDDCFSSVPYEKGSQFLIYLESVVGGEIFEAFLKAYFTHFQLKTLSTQDFQAFFISYFTDLEGFDHSVLGEIDWEAWFTHEGLPPVDVTTLLDRSLAEQSNRLADIWLSDEYAKIEGDNMSDWFPLQKVAFLSRLLLLTEGAPLSVEKLAHMANVYNLSSSENSELRFRWSMLCVNGGYETEYHNVVAFLVSMGRMKFVRPLYRAMAAQPNARSLALDTFNGMYSSYHAICQKMVAKDLGISLSDISQ